MPYHIAMALPNGGTISECHKFINFSNVPAATGIPVFLKIAVNGGFGAELVVFNQPSK
jgi:hypothetical protein